MIRSKGERNCTGLLCGSGSDMKPISSRGGIAHTNNLQQKLELKLNNN